MATPGMIAASRFAKPGPGSKKPEPATICPVTVTSTDDASAGIVGGVTDEGVAGGGASSRTTRVSHVPSASVYSWIVQNVMSSSGSTSVLEKSPQRRTEPGRNWP